MERLPAALHNSGFGAIASSVIALDFPFWKSAA
jgi:hypothetical protein